MSASSATEPNELRRLATRAVALKAIVDDATFKKKALRDALLPGIGEFLSCGILEGDRPEIAKMYKRFVSASEELSQRKAVDYAAPKLSLEQLRAMGAHLTRDMEMLGPVVLGAAQANDMPAAARAAPPGVARNFACVALGTARSET